MAFDEDMRRTPSPLHLCNKRLNVSRGDKETREAAIMLASMSWMVDEETKNGKEVIQDNEKFSHLCSVFEEEYKHEKDLEKKQAKPELKENRPRTVSISCSTDTELSSSSNAEDEFDFRQFQIEEVDAEDMVKKTTRCPKRHMAIVSPPTSPYIKPKRNQPIPCYQDLSLLTSKVFQINKPTKTILRRKFSWKNYPELEAFLIANREEYLRHSALNYTLQQKQYNNRLTERLLELALSHGYVFDEEAFNFVTVRDRIRCYYKSYVQSSKKKGGKCQCCWYILN